jgi:hypothetical protein
MLRETGIDRAEDELDKDGEDDGNGLGVVLVDWLPNLARRSAKELSSGLLVVVVADGADGRDSSALIDELTPGPMLLLIPTETTDPNCWGANISSSVDR